MQDTEHKKIIRVALLILAVAAAAVLAFFAVYRTEVITQLLEKINGILTPFVVGAVIAYLVSPVCNWMQSVLARGMEKHLGMQHKQAMKRADTIAVTISILLVILIVVALSMMIVPNLVSSVVGLVEQMPDRLTATNEWLHDVLKNQPELQEYWDTFSDEAYERVQNWMNTSLMPTVRQALTSLGGGLVGMANVVKNALIGLVAGAYFLAGRKRFAAQAKIVLYSIFKKEWADTISEEISYADLMFSGFINGKLLDSLIIGLICYVMLGGFHSTMAITTPSPLLISVIIGVTNIIPFFGPFIGAVPCALLYLMVDPAYALYFVIFVLVLQQFDGNILGPKILGNTTGLSSFWVLFSILLFGGLFGFVGMIIGVPLFAVIYDVIRRLLFANLRKHEAGQMLLDYNAQFGDHEEKSGAEQGEHHVAIHFPPRSRREKKEIKRQKKRREPSEENRS